MHTLVKSQLVAAATGDPTREVCALLYADGPRLAVHSCRNIAPDPTSEFEVSTDDYIEVMRRGTLCGIFHSHPDTASFSPADLDCAEEMGLPFYLYSLGDRQWREYLPSTYQPSLEGRPFVLGTDDCYSLIRLYYRQHFNHYLSDYDRDDTFCHEEQGVIMENFEKEGLQRIEARNVQPHDILLFHTDKIIPQHFGVLTGPQRLLHHPRGCLSRTETITDRWLSRLICAVRLKSRPE
jgi:proteasome lid subunit RPN8/RPN11